MWRKPTEDDLTTALSIDERRFYLEKFAVDADAIVPAVLARAVDRCWGYLRKSGVALGAPGTLPPEVIPVAMDIACYNLIVRINLTPSEGRQKLYEEAIAFLEAVAEKKMSVEPGAEAPADQYTEPVPAFERRAERPARMFTRRKADGI